MTLLLLLPYAELDDYIRDNKTFKLIRFLFSGVPRLQRRGYLNVTTLYYKWN